ncbi:hypothetical protein BDV96DRAFT_642937 [Lophiotrema nucula]|uniref:Uncharacterized protein n=1 Tax=Lophiotrema nucula TaxID=690887 RepID=A0A6A5ZKI5_9PLEO|nr:hypothetical protein BDV96DRAFT_642937 [Lophiotrema nucula]
MDSSKFSDSSPLASNNRDSPAQDRDGRKHSKDRLPPATLEYNSPHRFPHSSNFATRTTPASAIAKPIVLDTYANSILPKQLTGLFVRPASYYLQPRMTTYYTPGGQPYVMPPVDAYGYSSVSSAALGSIWSNPQPGNYYRADHADYGSHSGMTLGLHPLQYVSTGLEGEDGENGDEPTSGTETPDGGSFEFGDDEGYFDGATLHGSPLGNHDYPAYFGYTFPSARGQGQELMTTSLPHQPFQQAQLSAPLEVSPDDLRKFCDLHGLAKQLPPSRLNNALYGKYIDIVEIESERVLLHHVPKKMLILFIGRERVTPFLRTVSEHDKSEQVLRMPPGSTNHVGLKILVAWMTRACKYETMSNIEPIRIPKHTFAAISLARILGVFGLHQDCDRVDRFLNNHHFRRPLYIDQVKEIWKLLPKDSKYTFRMIKQLSESLEANQRGFGKAQPDKEEILEFIENHPTLKARIMDQTKNEMWKPDHKGITMVEKEERQRATDMKTSEWKRYQQRAKTPPVLNIVFKET